MKKISTNLWIDNDESYVQSYSTKVALIDHDERTVTALGWWSVTTSRHIHTVAKIFGYHSVHNTRRYWYGKPTRIYKPQPSMRRGYLECIELSRSRRQYTPYQVPERISRLREAWSALTESSMSHYTLQPQ